MNDSFFAEGAEWSGSCGSDFTMYENPSFSMERGRPYKMDRTLVIFCTGGNASGRVNLKDYRIVKDGLLVVLPNHIMEMDGVSGDFRATYIITSEAFQSSLDIAGSYGLHLEMEEHPWRNFHGTELEAIGNYFRMCKGVLSAEDNPNRLEILRLLTKAFYLGLGYYLHSDGTHEADTREERLTRRFLSLVEASYTKHREVNWYASEMAVSPKYLSMSVKASSGKTPGEWIESYVTLDARAQLASTEKSILQISDSLGFGTQSDFGRYFKRMAGMSPKAYRASLR